MSHHSGAARPRRSSVRAAFQLPREPVRIHVRPSGDLSPHERDEVWALTERYVDTDREVYEAKLRGVREVALFRTTGGTLAGVMSFEANDATWDGRRRRVIFTSNAVIDERYRRQHLPLRLGMRVFAGERLRHPLAPIDWMFDTFSFRSYVLLPRNFADFWPRRDRPVPAPVAAYMGHLAQARYGDAWRADRGLVERGGKRLRAETAPVGEAERRDPDIRFFAEANPGHAEGDMLVCLTPLHLANWVAVLRRAAGKLVAVRSRARGLRKSGAFAALDGRPR
jgi:hypothetical protein